MKNEWIGRIFVGRRKEKKGEKEEDFVPKRPCRLKKKGVILQNRSRDGTRFRSYRNR